MVDCAGEISGGGPNPGSLLPDFGRGLDGSGATYLQVRPSRRQMPHSGVFSSHLYDRRYRQNMATLATRKNCNILNPSCFARLASISRLLVAYFRGAETCSARLLRVSSCCRHYSAQPPAVILACLCERELCRDGDVGTLFNIMASFSRDRTRHVNDSAWPVNVRQRMVRVLECSVPPVKESWSASGRGTGRGPASETFSHPSHQFLPLLSDQQQQHQIIDIHMTDVLCTGK